MRSIMKKSPGLKTFSIAAMLAATSTSVLAQNLNINNDTVTVTSGGGFNQALAIPANGILPNITIPLTGITGAAATPNFSFTLEQVSVGDGEYQFSAAFVIDDNNSARRLEIMIPTIRMTFSSGALTGTVDAGSTVTVLGRAADNTTQLSATVANALFNFNGSTLSFNSGAQVSEIAGKGGILGDIATTIAANGVYTYAVVLKQKTGAQALTIGRETGGFVALGCAPSSTFVLGSNQFASLAGGYGLQGQFAAGAGGFGAAPTQFSATCTTNISSSGGGGSTSTPATEAAALDTATTDLTTSITANGFTDAAAEQLTTVLSDTATTVTNVSAGLADGTVDTQVGIDLLGTLRDQAVLVENAYDATPSTDPAAATKRNQLRSVARPLAAQIKGLLAGLKAKSLTTTERDQVLTQINSFTSAFRRVLLRAFSDLGLLSDSLALIDISSLTTNTVVADMGAVISDYSAGLSDLLSTAGFTMDSTLHSNAQSLSQTVAEGVFASLGTELGLSIAYTNDSSAQALLASNTTLLSRLVDVVGVSLGNSTEIDAATTNAALVAEGVSGSFVSALTADIALFVKADDLQIDSGAGLVAASSTLQTALGADTLTVNATTGAVNYTNGGSSSVRFLKSVMPAPAMFPSGVHTLSDGSTLINDGNLLYVLVSGSNSITDFAGAIHTAGNGGFSTSITDSGVIKLTETASSVIFSSTVSTSGLTTATATSTTTFEAPSVTDPADSAYRFVVQYDDGTRQEILPAISDAAFFTSVGNAGFQVQADRRTGIITIGSFSFRPDFFQTPLTAADTTYHAANADTSGVAYRAVDANGDGVTDYQVLTATGVQTVYTLP